MCVDVHCMQISFLSDESRGAWEADVSDHSGGMRHSSSFLTTDKPLNKRKKERSESASSFDTDFSLKRPRFTSLEHDAPVIGISDVLNSSLLMSGLVKDEDCSDKEEADFKCDNSMAVEWSSDDSNGERLLNREDSLPIISSSPLLVADLPNQALDADADKSSTIASVSSYRLDHRSIVDLANFEDDDESASSVATSLFVEVASVDEGGSYQGYGGASETERYEIEGDDDETVVTDSNSFYLGDSSYKRAPSSCGKRVVARGSANGSSNSRGDNRDAEGNSYERRHRSSMKAWEWESGYDGEEDTSERGGLRDGGCETDADYGEEMEELGSLTEEDLDEEHAWGYDRASCEDREGSRDNLSTMATANGDTRERLHSPSLSPSSPLASLAWSGASRAGSKNKRRYRKTRSRHHHKDKSASSNADMPIQ